MWAALRWGFGAVDWVEPFTQACDKADLPKGDFLVFRPCVGLKTFTRHPAGWADANMALHALLVVAGVPIDQVIQYTMHSFRHVYPTCGFQLMFPPSAVTLMGHWATKKDQMASVYDSTRVSTELAYKANIAANVHKGWRPVVDGTIPRGSLVPLGVAQQQDHQPAAPLASRPKKKARKRDDAPVLPAEHGGAEAATEARSTFDLPTSVIQVLNTKTKWCTCFAQ